MSLKVAPIAPIPDTTRSLAEALLSPNNLYRVIGDRLSDFISDEDFVDIYPKEGAPALPPSLVAMVTVFQFVENLSDRQAVTMLVNRIDWKYALHLPLEYEGFDHTVLHDFRERLAKAGQSALVFDKLVGRLKEIGLVRGRGKQRTDSFAVLAAVRSLSRLEVVVETLRVTLSAIECIDAAWLRGNVPGEWGDTYGERTQEERLVKETGEKGKEEVRRLAVQTGKDGLLLLSRLEASGTPDELRGLGEVVVLREVWQQQFVIREEAEQVEVEWPEKPVCAGAELIQTPHDPDARYSEKHGKSWKGYKAHYTETVEEDLPRIITDIQTVPATEPDVKAVAPVQESLKTRGLEPEEQIVDRGYVSGKTLAESKDNGVNLVGPVAADNSPQAKMEEGITLEQFEIDRESKTAQCPGGSVSAGWVEQEDRERGEKVIQTSFRASDCARCPLYSQCVTSKKAKPQGRRLKIREYHEQVQQRRQEQKTEAFKEACWPRAGVEASLSEMARAHGLRQARYVGRTKVHYQHLMIGAAVNLKRSARWLAGRQRESIRPRYLRSLVKVA